MVQENNTAVATFRRELNVVLAMQEPRQLPMDYNDAHRCLAIRPEEDDLGSRGKH